MFSNLFEDGRAFILRCFPERQIYLRSGGEVSYHTLKTRTQVACAILAALVSFWCLLTLFNLIWGNNPLRTPAQQNRLVKAEYQRLLEDAEARYDDAQLQLTQQQESFERAARSFQEKHAALSQLASQANADITPSLIETANYSKGQVLVAPTARDPFPRVARNPALHFAGLNTGTNLDQPMENLGRNQNALLVAAEINTHDKIEANRAIIRATDLSIDRVLNAGLAGKGGPLVEIEEQASSDKSGIKDDARILNIRARTEEARRLDEAMKAIPLGVPVASDYYRTSSYGRRTDPFTKRPAQHRGLDLASFRMAPIVATADGTVKFVGVKGGYGRVVEIDHGYGFVTRYAHMAKTYVKRGQKLKRGDKIGGMGSTGRSTSTHLHYEVRFQGQYQNPDKFLKAGRYVQQN